MTGWAVAGRRWSARTAPNLTSPEPPSSPLAGVYLKVMTAELISKGGPGTARRSGS